MNLLESVKGLPLLSFCFLVTWNFVFKGGQGGVGGKYVVSLRCKRKEDRIDC